MLTLTDNAKDVVREMVAEGGAPDGSGLRIAAEPADGGGTELSLSFTVAPEEGDAVLDADGTRVFLDQAAAELLDEMVLDAHRHDDHVHFTVIEPTDQQPGQ